MIDTILIIDFGSQVTQLIARRIRELNIYSEVKNPDITISEIKKINPKGIIFSGGPSSVYEKGAPTIDKKVFGVNFGSVLGIDQLKINAVEKIACEPIVSKKITCQVLVDFEFVNKKDGLTELLGGLPKTKKIVEYQFVKTGQGWQVLELVEKK